MTLPASTRAFRLASALAAISAFLLFWLSLGVGIIGADGDPANLMYALVLAIGVAGAYIARLQADGMKRVLIAMAAAQALIAAIAVSTGMGKPWSGALELIALNGFFVAAFLAAAFLYHRAAKAT
jgi:hypothetical protein